MCVRVSSARAAVQREDVGDHLPLRLPDEIDVGQHRQQSERAGRQRQRARQQRRALRARGARSSRLHRPDRRPRACAARDRGDDPLDRPFDSAHGAARRRSAVIGRVGCARSVHGCQHTSGAAPAARRSGRRYARDRAGSLTNGRDAHRRSPRDQGRRASRRAHAGRRRARFAATGHAVVVEQAQARRWASRTTRIVPPARRSPPTPDRRVGVRSRRQGQGGAAAGVSAASSPARRSAASRSSVATGACSRRCSRRACACIALRDVRDAPAGRCRCSRRCRASPGGWRRSRARWRSGWTAAASGVLLPGVDEVPGARVVVIGAGSGGRRGGARRRCARVPRDA